MFQAITHDFDSRYWSRGALAVLTASTVAVGAGVGWLVVVLVTRIWHLLLGWLLGWLFPPALVLAVRPYEPITYDLVAVEIDRGIGQEVDAVHLDLRMGEMVDLPDLEGVPVSDLPPDPDAFPGPELARIAVLDRTIAENAGLLSVLSRQGDGAMAGVFGAETIDGSLIGGVGGLIGARGTQIGSGGLGNVGTGLGGGGTAEGLGGLGTRGVGMGRVSTVGGNASAGGGGSGPAVARLGSPTVTGSLDREIIRRIVRRHLNSIRYCYQRELQKAPDLSGRILVGFTIGPSGAVSEASVSSSTVGSKGVERCVVGRFMRMKFPSPTGGGVVRVKYPFVFAPH